MPSRVLVVIPARFGSTRFPGKPLADIGGLPMILRVYRRAVRIAGVDEVLVATDSALIKDVVEAGGGTAVMTARAHRTGTSRVSEVASRRRSGIVVNIQGDEPLFPAGAVGRLIACLRENPRILMGTLAAPSTDPHDLADPDVVKVVTAADDNALYFSRSPIPGSPAGRRPVPEARAPGRNRTPGAGRTKKGGPSAPASRCPERFLRHIGIYAYRRSFLLRYPALPKGPLERTEGLEQLRALENGFAVRVVMCRAFSAGVDRPGDIKRVEKLLESR